MVSFQNMKNLLRLVLFSVLGVAVGSPQELSSRIKRSLLFTPAAGMGIYLAIAFPIDLPRYEISVALNVEANYFLPTNATELAYGFPQLTEVRKARDLTRGKLYSLIEDRLQTGLLNKSCLLRAICETSATAIKGHNGLLGEVIHLIFTPSSTRAEEDISPEYEQAEKLGIGGRNNCIRKYVDCSLDFYDFFSILLDA